MRPGRKPHGRRGPASEPPSSRADCGKGYWRLAARSSTCGHDSSPLCRPQTVQHRFAVIALRIRAALRSIHVSCNRPFEFLPALLTTLANLPAETAGDTAERAPALDSEITAAELQ